MSKNTNKSISKQDTYAQQVLLWAKFGGSLTEDVSRGILGFIPNGLNVTYDHTLKEMMLLGKIFSHRWVEQVFKLGTGITIGQGLAQDIAHFIFWPIGFIIGALTGSLLAHQKRKPVYHGQIGKTFYRLSGQTVGGALLGMVFFVILYQCFPALLEGKGHLRSFALFAFAGATLGLLSKILFLLAINAVQESHASTIRRNVQRAKELNSKLKMTAKHKAKSRILMQAQDIIQQVNGSQSQQYLEEFFEEKYESIAISTYQKIERHFNYLADRACHGDLNALKRLKELTASQSTLKQDEKSPLDLMLDRIFNSRAIAKIKDDVDTIYDRWHYRFLAHQTN